MTTEMITEMMTCDYGYSDAMLMAMSIQDRNRLLASLAEDMRIDRALDTPLGREPEFGTIEDNDPDGADRAQTRYERFLGL